MVLPRSETTGETPNPLSEPVLPVDEIQGNVLPGFGTLFQTLIGLRIAPQQGEAAKGSLAQLLPLVSTLRQVYEVREKRRAARLLNADRPATPLFLNLAFSIGGLRLLLPDADAMLDSSFKTGMPALSASLGDPNKPTQEGHPTQWKVGGTTETIPDVFLIVGCDQLEELRRFVDEWLTWVQNAESGLSLLYQEEGAVLPGEKEHFGFRDGLSQPGVRGRLSEAPDDFLTRRAIAPDDPRSQTHAKPGQPLLWPGQFLFGWAQQDPSDPLRPGPIAEGGPDWTHNGSLLVFRRLRQDVMAFRTFVATEAARLQALPAFADMTPERLAAKLVGRWPSGAPLIRYPDADDPSVAADRFLVNHFTFSEETQEMKIRDEDAEGQPIERLLPGAPADPQGQRCPFFAHILKVNPRDLSTDQLDGNPTGTLTFAILRRGIPFGPPFPSEPNAPDPANGERGLLFLCYQTDIGRQFRTLNDLWMNRKFGPVDNGFDLLVGQSHAVGTDQRTAILTTAAGSEATLQTQHQWVIPTGGGFFFAPSLSALREVLGVGR